MKFKFLLFFLLAPHIAFAYYVRHPCCSRFQPYGWWGSADYLFLWRKQRFYPPLVTTNPTLTPTLSNPGTTILFGNEEIGGAPKSGGRGDFGMWLTKCMGAGIGFFALGEEETEFDISGRGGFPILGRPFFNTSSGVQDVSLVSFPTLNTLGDIDIDTSNRIWGFDLYARYRFFHSQHFKFDFLGGFLYNTITDSLDVSSNTTTAVLERISITDHFSCENNYYSGLVGLIAEWRSCNWAVTVTGKVGIGNMQKEVEISGTTTTALGGVVTKTKSGLLAQPSNIGNHKNTKFEVIPEINANLQLKIWPHVWVTAGYTYTYWPAVALAGDQVNLNINPTQSPGPLVGTPSPFFHENLTSFWVQGITAGFYFCY